MKSRWNTLGKATAIAAFVCAMLPFTQIGARFAVWLWIAASVFFALSVILLVVERRAAG